MPEPFDIARLPLKETSEIHALLKHCPDIETRRYLDGEFLMREGEESLDLFIVLEGAYVVERPPERTGDPATVLAMVSADLETPSFVGEMAYFGKQRRSASVRSSGCTYALCLHTGHIESIVEGFPGLLRIIFRQFAHRLSEANHSLKALQARFAMPTGKRMAAPGERLFSAGDPAITLFQLVLGEIRSEAGEVLGPEDLPQGFLDLEAFLKGDVHTSTLFAENTTLLLTVESAHREAFIRCFPQLTLACLEKRKGT